LRDANTVALVSDHQRDTGFDRERAGENARRFPFAFRKTARPGAHPVECFLNALGVGLGFVRPRRAWVSASGISSAESVVHAAGNFGSTTVARVLREERGADNE
jgi:hypothetical protein